MSTVIAATPSSPNSFIIVILNRNVVTAVEHWLTSSDTPLEQLFSRTDASILGLQKCNSLLYIRKNTVPIIDGIIYPMPVPIAAPLIPICSKTIKT